MVTVEFLFPFAMYCDCKDFFMILVAYAYKEAKQITTCFTHKTKNKNLKFCICLQSI